MVGIKSVSIIFWASQTSKIGIFKIVSEGGIGAGTRRIEAVTGKAAYEAIKEEESSLVEELIELEQDKEVRKYITLIRHCRAILFKAICKFYLGEVEYSKGLAFEVLEILEKNPSTHSSGKEDHQRISLMSQTIELLAEIHDLEKNKISTLDCYQKLYYLNLGKYGEENSNTKKYKKMKGGKLCFMEKILKILMKNLFGKSLLIG